ncbi:tellurium resistance protein D family protein [Streptomyces phage LilMartin]|nr:tellurium resistance protein D family protein [Streptomyces phage LilMartin]QNO12561.1 hypothetical protein SEA_MULCHMANSION_164 [Streptomyces phage MulchMansion]UVK61231.1 tellurium resistance protein D family protein [Streptomyces phage Angela]
MGLFGSKKNDVAPVTQAAAPAVSTGKMSLTKGGSSAFSLEKGTKVTATLEWDGGSASRRSKGADLELYALYVTKDKANRMRKDAGGAVYWNNLVADGIRHHGDSLVPGKETVTIENPGNIGYVLIVAYSAVSNGAGSFKSYGAKAVVTDGKGQTVTAPLYNNNHGSYWVAIALVDFTTEGQVSIKHVEDYSRGGEARPVLYSDGTHKMDVGPVEFKR